MQTMSRQNDFVLTWDSVDLATNKSFVNDATVTMTLTLTSTGATVVSAVSMTYVTDSNGKYQGKFPASSLPSSLAFGEIYTIVVAATSGSFTGYAKLSAELVERVS